MEFGGEEEGILPLDVPHSRDTHSAAVVEENPLEKMLANKVRCGSSVDVGVGVSWCMGCCILHFRGMNASFLCERFIQNLPL